MPCPPRSNTPLYILKRRPLNSAKSSILFSIGRAAMFPKYCLPTLALMLLGAAAHAQSSLIVADGFAGPPGAITGQSSGYGWQAGKAWTSSSAANPDQVTSGGLTFSSNGQTLAVSGGKLTTVGGDVGAYRRPPTDFGPYGGDVNQDIWIGFLTSNTTSDMASAYAGLSLFNTSEQFFVGVPTGTDAYGFQNTSISGPDGAAQTAPPGLATPSAQTHFLVTHFSFTASGTTEVTLYVDPTPGLTDPLPAPLLDKVYTTSFQFNELRFQSGSDAGGAAHPYNFDELRMGSTYGDVAPAAAPEPSSCAALGMGLLGLSLLAIKARPRPASRRPCD